MIRIISVEQETGKKILWARIPKKNKSLIVRSVQYFLDSSSDPKHIYIVLPDNRAVSISKFGEYWKMRKRTFDERMNDVLTGNFPAGMFAAEDISKGEKK